MPRPRRAGRQPDRRGEGACGPARRFRAAGWPAELHGPGPAAAPRRRWPTKVRNRPPAAAARDRCPAPAAAAELSRVEIGQQEWRGGADRRRPAPAARQRDRHHLQEEDQEHQPPVRAQGFQDGDVEALAVQKGRHRFAGADAAHAQRRQAHQSQEHRHLFDKAADAGRGIVAVADLPAGIGKGACRHRP